MKNFTQNQAVTLYNEALDSVDASLSHEVASIILLRLTTESEKETRKAVFNAIFQRYPETSEHKTGLTYNAAKKLWQLNGGNQRKLGFAIAFYNAYEAQVKSLVNAAPTGREARLGLVNLLVGMYDANKGTGRKHFSLQLGYNTLVKKQEIVVSGKAKEKAAPSEKPLKQVNKPKQDGSNPDSVKKYCAALEEGIKSAAFIEAGESSEYIVKLFHEITNNPAISKALQEHVAYMNAAKNETKAA